MEHIEIFEGERAREYENRIGKMIPFYSGILELVASLLVQSVEKGSDILCAGCGAGGDFRHLLKVAPDYRITGVDPSPEMIEQAKSVYPDVSFFCGTVSELDIGKKFQAATLLFVLHFLPDTGEKLYLLKNISDRLESGGKLILFDLYNSFENMDFIWGQLNTFLKINYGWDETTLSGYINRVKNLHRISEERYIELLQEAGFARIIPMYRVMHTIGWVAEKI